MSWTDTHRRWQILREVEATLAADSAELPWNDEYAEVFGTPEALLEMLRYRWKLSYDTQVDLHVPEDVLDDQRRRLERRSAGVRRLLARYDASRIAA